MAQFASAGLVYMATKGFANFFVERWVFVEPGLHTGIQLRRGQLTLLEPEGQDTVDRSLVFVGQCRAEAFAE